METLIKINKSEEKGILIFEFSWELDETNADKTFKSIYEQIWEFENKKILLKLTGLKYINSKSIWYIADIFSNIEEKEVTKIIQYEVGQIFARVLEDAGVYKNNQSGREGFKRFIETVGIN